VATPAGSARSVVCKGQAASRRASHSGRESKRAREREKETISCVLTAQLAQVLPATHNAVQTFAQRSSPPPLLLPRKCLPRYATTCTVGMAMRSLPVVSMIKVHRGGTAPRVDASGIKLLFRTIPLSPHLYPTPSFSRTQPLIRNQPCRAHADCCEFRALRR
jgi:hypothetical protein